MRASSVNLIAKRGTCYIYILIYICFINLYYKLITSVVHSYVYAFNKTKQERRI